MGRPKRAADGGLIYHVLNRANARMPIFEKPEDYAAFERVLEEAVERTGTRLLAYCVLSTHWHLVLWPQEDGELSRFTGWLTLTHTQRWHAHRHSIGSGHVYQGRFKSFPVQDDEHFYTVCRYVERNALRANLVRRGGLALGKSPSLATGKCKGLVGRLAPAALANWVQEVNVPHSEAELSALRRSVNRGCPFGEACWSDRIVARLGLESTLRFRGRPKKHNNGS